MYSKLRLFELKNTNFKTKHDFLHKINLGFRGGEFYIPGEFWISYSKSPLGTSWTCFEITTPKLRPMHAGILFSPYQCCGIQ